MALKKETLQKIATLLKVKDTDLETAIKDTNEVDFTIDEKLTVLTEPELTTLKSNSYNDGKKAGVEIDIKDAKEKYGLDFTGKTFEGLLDAYGKKVLKDAKIEPDKKVTELEQKITTMQNTIRETEAKLAEKETEATTAVVNSELYQHIPEPGENGPAFTKAEVVGWMRMNGIDVKREDGAFKPYKDGKLMTDKLGNPLPVKDVVTGFITEKKLITTPTVPGGRGGKDEKPPAKATKMSELKKQFADQGKHLQGEEFAKAVAEAAKDKEFDMNA